VLLTASTFVARADHAADALDQCISSSNLPAPEHRCCRARINSLPRIDHRAAGHRERRFDQQLWDSRTTMRSSTL
jgi:hypothetical protein